MILRILKTNLAYNFVLIPLIAILLWLPSLIEPSVYPFYPGEDSMVLYKPIAWLLSKNLFANNLLALGMIILLSFLTIRLNVKYAFIRIRTFLPASLLIIITSGVKSLHSMHPVYIAALFFIYAIDRIFDSYEKGKIHSNSFDGGFLIAIGSLFYLNLIFVFPFVWIGLMVIHKKLEWRDFFLPILGLALPWVFTFTYFFVVDDVSGLLDVIEKNIFSDISFLNESLPLQIYFGYLLLLILIASYFILTQYDEKKISSRKYFKVFFWIFILPVIILIGVPSVSQEILILLAIPLTYLISNYFVFIRRKFWGELFLYVLLVMVIALQFINASMVAKISQFVSPLFSFLPL